MKSMAELAEIRKKMQSQIHPRELNDDDICVVVGMATCGIAAGARTVLSTLVEEVQTRHLDNVSVRQTGCIGLCSYEPIVEVYAKDSEKVTYIKVDADRARRIIDEHIIGGKVVSEFVYQGDK
jgi:NADP-reducing hydrogenase subunit HndB